VPLPARDGPTRSPHRERPFCSWSLCPRHCINDRVAALQYWTSLCSNRGSRRQYLKCIRTRNAVTVHASVKRGSVIVIKRKDFAAFIECDRALFQIDRGAVRLALPSSRRTDALIFPLLFKRFGNRPISGGIFSKQRCASSNQHSHLLRQTLRLFVQLICRRVSSSHTSVGLSTQFLD